jgi:hypothetical protein
VRLTTSARVALVAGLVVVAAACSDDGGSGVASSSTSTTTSASSTTVRTGVGDDPTLQPLLLALGDLPPGFATSAEVDDTVTTFCVGEDAAAGLQASGRALVAYTRTPAGASVVHLVFRFRDGDAARFVTQATDILGRCSNIPDASGLAFAYEATSPAVEAAVAGTDAHVTSHGTSAGSGKLTLDLAVFRRGDVGELVAALSVDQARAASDPLAVAAFTAAVARLPKP